MCVEFESGEGWRWVRQENRGDEVVYMSRRRRLGRRRREGSSTTQGGGDATVMMLVVLRDSFRDYDRKSASEGKAL